MAFSVVIPFHLCMPVFTGPILVGLVLPFVMQAGNVLSLLEGPEPKLGPDVPSWINGCLSNDS